MTRCHPISWRHVVMFSSGAGSAVAAKRVAETHGTDQLVLLFADVNMEHPDNYRFLREASEWVGGDLVVLDNDGKTIWDVFREGRFLGNTRVDLCSRVLKREPMRTWLDDNHDPENTTVHLGFDISEPHRLPRAQPHWEPWHVEAPLLWEPVVWKDEALDILRDAGIEPPLLTRMGWPHANCGGGCVKAGIGQFSRLYRALPDTFAEWERNEAAIAEHLDKPVAILRDRTGGEATPLPLSELRERIEAEDKGSLLALLETDLGDSCNCMGHAVTATCASCGAESLDLHQLDLCGSCCDDRVARIIEDLARLDVTAAADLAGRLGVPQVVKAALSAGRVVWPDGQDRTDRKLDENVREAVSGE